ncbi:hypothetical protein ENBRE01_1095 [Enteropsectra breve]|nr:hypothetical protein ENBRE01_1095 [Enteropsectra breve]
MQRKEKSAKGIYSIEVKDWQGIKRSMGDYAGKPLLIVNVASNCGLAKQSYLELAEILEKYHSKGLRILLFPCRQFLKQEFSQISKVKEVADSYSGKFDLMDYVEVMGSGIHPLFKYLCDNLKGFLTNSIKWNFTYFLIGRKGELVRRFAPMEHIKHDDPDLVRCVGNAKSEAPQFQGKASCELEESDE